MKRKIVIGLTLFCLLFLIGGYAVIRTIGQSNADLNNLMLLHQVELVREQLLIELRRTQLDLQVNVTPRAKDVDSMFGNVSAMDAAIRVCFECHHAPAVTERLNSLQERIERYKEALSRTLTSRNDARRLAAAKKQAFRIGEAIVAEVADINDLTTRRLRAQSTHALEEGRRTERLIFVILAATPVLVLGLSLLFLRGFTRPVGTLLRATRRLRDGDLNYRIEGLKDEYGEVAESFNMMAVSLKEHLEHMQWAEQVVVLGELAGGLAHEIKNPLAGVKASVEVLALDPAMSSENRDILGKVAEQVKRMETLIRSFMNFARPPAPQFSLINMHAVLDATVALAQRHPLFSRTRSGRVAIAKEYDLRIPQLTADPTQLQQVFLNLLLNAAEAMPGGGTVTVRTSYETDAESLIVRVQDTGKGIDAVVRDKIFQPFFTTKVKGTGLGLSITKRLVEQQGGSIRCENAEGGGAAFIITVPVPVSVEVPVPVSGEVTVP